MSRYKFKPSRTAAREFAQKMDAIDQFCAENGIQQSRTSDSYYFFLNGKSYRVSNHTIAASYNNSLGRYHQDGTDPNTVYITAGKTRIIEIYTALQEGKELDKRGNIK